MSDALPEGARHVHIGHGEEWGARTPTPALPPAPPPPPPPPAPPAPPAPLAPPVGPLHDALGQLGAAVSELTAAGTDEQVAIAGDVLERARRDLHRVLAGETP